LWRQETNDKEIEPSKCSNPFCRCERSIPKDWCTPAIAQVVGSRKAKIYSLLVILCQLDKKFESCDTYSIKDYETVLDILMYLSEKTREVWNDVYREVAPFRGSCDPFDESFIDESKHVTKLITDTTQNYKDTITNQCREKLKVDEKKFYVYLMECRKPMFLRASHDIQFIIRTTNINFHKLFEKMKTEELPESKTKLFPKEKAPLKTNKSMFPSVLGIEERNFITKVEAMFPRTAPYDEPEEWKIPV